MSSFSADETSPSNRCQDGDDGMMEVTITVISLDGLVTKNHHPKTKLQTMLSKSHHQFMADSSTSIVTSISQDLSTDKTFFTHVPSLPLGLDKSFLALNQSSYPVIHWPAEDDACVDKHQLLSTVRIVRTFQREMVEGNNSSATQRLKPQTFPINISLSRHGKLINLGQASVIVNGEETGTSSVSIPVTSTVHKSMVKAGIKGKKGTPMMRIKDDCIKFGLKSDATLRVLVSVKNIGSEASHTRDIVVVSPRDSRHEYEDFPSDPSGVYDDVDIDINYYVVDDRNFAKYEDAKYEEDEDDDSIGACSLSLSAVFSSPVEDEVEDDYSDESEADIVVRKNSASVSTLGSPGCSQYAPLLPLQDNDYEVGDTIFVQNNIAEVRALRRELSESKYIIQNLTDVLISALSMSQDGMNQSSTSSLRVAMNTIQRGCCPSPAAASSLPPPPPLPQPRVPPQNDLCKEKGRLPPPPPPPRAPPQLAASELMHELAKIADSPDEEQFVDDGSESKLGDESDHSFVSSEEDVTLPRRAPLASLSLETVQEEDEEQACMETQPVYKHDSVAKDEVSKKDANELITDKSSVKEELKWKNILDKVSPHIRTGPLFMQDKVKHDIRKGLPDSMRRRTWVVLTGVDRLMSERKGVYQEMLRQANSISQTSGLTPNGKHTNRTVLNQIDKDTDRTSLKHSSSKRTFSRRELRRVLRAYSQIDSDVGYCQGMNYIVATFLSFVSEEEAFWLLVVVMNEEPYNLRDLFSEDMSGTHEILYIAEKLMKQFFPKLSKHLEREGVRSSMFVTQWLMTLYTSSFPLDFVSRVWDSFLVEGWKVVYRTMLGLIKHAEGTLLHLSFEHILHYLSSFPGKVDGQTIMQECLKIGLKTKHIQKHTENWQRCSGTCSQGPSSPKKICHLDSATLSTCSTSTRGL
eukprot:scaffold2236_cov152-Skeletonema_menzelii.AAC.19